MEKKWFDIILILFFVLLVVGFVVSYFVLRNEGSRCLEDPLGEVERALPGFTCSCFGIGANGLPVSVTSNGNYSHVNQNKSLG